MVIEDTIANAEKGKEEEATEAEAVAPRAASVFSITTSSRTSREVKVAAAAAATNSMTLSNTAHVSEAEVAAVADLKAETAAMEGKVVVAAVAEAEVAVEAHTAVKAVEAAADPLVVAEAEVDADTAAVEAEVAVVEAVTATALAEMAAPAVAVAVAEVEAETAASEAAVVAVAAPPLAPRPLRLDDGSGSNPVDQVSSPTTAAAGKSDMFCQDPFRRGDNTTPSTFNSFNFTAHLPAGFPETTGGHRMHPLADAPLTTSMLPPTSILPSLTSAAVFS